MKRLIAILMCAVLLAGCGAQPDSQVSEDAPSVAEPIPQGYNPESAESSDSSINYVQEYESSISDKASNPTLAPKEDPYLPANTLGFTYDQIAEYLTPLAEAEGLLGTSYLRTEDKESSIDAGGYYNMKTVFLETDGFLYVSETVDGVVFGISGFGILSGMSESSLDAFFFYIIEIIRMLESDDEKAASVLDALNLKTDSSSSGYASGESAFYSYNYNVVDGTFFFSAMA